MRLPSLKTKNMKQKNIKKEITLLRDLAQIRLEEKRHYLELVVDMQDNVNVLKDRIWKLQQLCSHEYGDQKPGVRGKGVCVVCGASDY